MNGIHDMGGMHGMGPVEPETNEPTFHEPWEGRVFALLGGLGRWGRGRNWGNFRFELESIPAADYLRMSYYERWFTVLVYRLVRTNLVTAAELESGEADTAAGVARRVDGVWAAGCRGERAVPPGTTGACAQHASPWPYTVAALHTRQVRDCDS